MDDLARFMRAFAQFQQRLMGEPVVRNASDAPSAPDASAARGRRPPRRARTRRTQPGEAA